MSEDALSQSLTFVGILVRLARQQIQEQAALRRNLGKKIVDLVLFQTLWQDCFGVKAPGVADVSHQDADFRLDEVVFHQVFQFLEIDTGPKRVFELAVGRNEVSQFIGISQDAVACYKDVNGVAVLSLYSKKTQVGSDSHRR